MLKMEHDPDIQEMIQEVAEQVMFLALRLADCLRRATPAGMKAINGVANVGHGPPRQLTLKRAAGRFDLKRGMSLTLNAVRSRVHYRSHC